MPYRNDDAALDARRVELERELADLTARANEIKELEARRREIESELENVRKRQTKSRLPMLANAKIASPCSADWEKMVGSDQVRFCGSCQKNVYNLSAMTAAEAETLVNEKEGNLCARFYRRADGTMLTSDCSVGVRRKWVRRVGTAAVLLSSAVAGSSVLYREKKCELAMNGSDSSQPAVMGSIAVEVTSAPSGQTAQPVDTTEPASPKTKGTTTVGHPAKKPPKLRPIMGAMMATHDLK